LEATADCLAERGWSGTSTTEVSRRAGLSRGAQQHHYRTKAELVAATVDYLVDTQRGEFENGFASLPAEHRTAAGALDLLWSLFSGRTFQALHELVTAARTVPELAPLTGDLTDRLVGELTATARRALPELAGHPKLPVLARATLALYTGLALQTDAPTGAAGKQDVLVTIRALADSLLASAGEYRLFGKKGKKVGRSGHSD
jgi:AcrR family transcriptional regulator